MPALAPFLMAAGGGLGALLAPKEQRSKMIPQLQQQATRMEKRFVRTREERKDMTRKVPYVVQTEKEVGTKYLQGGYPVVKNLLSIGLAVESIGSSHNLLDSFDGKVKAKQEQVQAMLGSHEKEINQLAQSSTTPKKTKQAEERIIEILQKATIS